MNIDIDDRIKFNYALEKLWYIDSLKTTFEIKINEDWFDKNNKRFKICFKRFYIPFYKTNELTSWQQNYINKNRGYDYPRTIYYLCKEDEFKIINHLKQCDWYLEEVNRIKRVFKETIENYYIQEDLSVLIWIDTCDIEEIVNNYKDSCPYILLRTDWVEGGYTLKDKY